LSGPEIRPKESLGSVDLVGAGPGDPGLITRLGARSLALADVVVYDHLVHPRLLDLAPGSAEKILAGKRAGKCVLRQPEINDLLVRLAREGKRVVRLKGGDPFVFGRGGEEAERLAAEGIPFRVIPGVTAAVGVAAYAGIPITHRSDASAVAFVTGHDDPSCSRLDWEALARFPGTLVIYMAVSRLRMICQTLIELGKSPETPAALVHSGTLANQTTIASTLAGLADAVEQFAVGPPALVIVGEVVDRRAAISWFEKSPLFGQTIVVTRPSNNSDDSAADLEALGAEVLVAPTVEILPPEDWAPVDSAIDRLREFDWLVFTSGNGVRSFLDRLESLGADLRRLGKVRIAAIGSATASVLREYRLNADVVPESFRSESLAQALSAQVGGCRILLARADRGRALLKDELDRIAIVEQVAVYRNVDAPSVSPEVLDRIAAGSVQWITLTSSAITLRLHALLPKEAHARIGRDIRLASISPVTTESANSLGWSVAAEAKEYTWEGLVHAIVAASK
jgi:uroporphyrinogen III methyltransferase/synthase